YVVGMVQSPVNRRRARRVMCHQDEWSTIPLSDDSVQIPFLILGGVWIPCRLVGSAPPKKIKGHYSPRRRKIRNEPVIEVMVIREAVHQDDGRLVPRVFPEVDAMLASLDELFAEIHFVSPRAGWSRGHLLRFLSDGSFSCVSKGGHSP